VERGGGRRYYRPEDMGRLVAESGEPRCVVNLVERRGGCASVVLRPMDLEGRAGSAREGRELVRFLAAASLRPSKGRDKLVEVAVDAWTAIVRARQLQPPRLDGASPQLRMLEAATRAGALTRELVGLMSLRYRAGTELMIARAAGSRIDDDAVALLVRAIGDEARDREPYEAALTGSIVTRGWLRAARGFATGGGYNRPVCR